MTAGELFPQGRKSTKKTHRRRGSRSSPSHWHRPAAPLCGIAVPPVFHNAFIALLPGLFTIARKKIKKSLQTLLRFFADTHRSRPPTRRTLILLREGRLAQLVERLVYTEDVGSSSLSSPTIYPLI
jgi:hypothetical protein